MSVISEVTRELFAFTKDECFRLPILSTGKNPNQTLVRDSKKPDDLSLAADNELKEDQYVAVPQAFLHLAPSHSYDGVTASIPYGLKVQCLKNIDDWLLVRTGSIKGWILKENLKSYQDIFPEFVDGQVYSADSDTALKLRQFIQDEFYGGGAGVPCTPAEYVWYRLVSEGRSFSWLPLRPRTVGRWSHLLVTSDSVLISEVPITGAIMEYTKSGIGYLWYVDAVDKEESLVISGIDGANSRFTRRSIKKIDWKKYSPRFICPL